MKSRNLLIVILAAIAALSLAACAPSEPALGTPENPIVFSFVPSQDAEQVLANANAITDILSEITGLSMRSEVPTSFVGAIEAMCAGEAHVGALNTFSYVLASERGCADVALVSIRFGSGTYGGQIIVRADSGITSVAQLEGTTFCRPDPLSTSGWIIPSIALRAEGLNPDTDIEILDAGGHSGVVRSVYNGECAGGATFTDARSGVASEYPDVNEVVVVIVESPPIPNDTISIIPSVPAEIREQIVAALEAMTDDPEQLEVLAALYSWEDLQRVDNSFYDPFRQVLQSAGVDVATFVNP